MFIATNRIKIKSGHGDDLETRFGHSGGVEKEPGFLGFELWRMDGTNDHEEYLVVSRWEAKEDHDKWTQGESFRRAHSGPPADYIMGRGEFSSYDVRLSTRPAA